MRKKTKDDENRHTTQLFQERTIKRKNMGARHHSGQIMKIVLILKNYPIRYFLNTKLKAII